MLVTGGLGGLGLIASYHCAAEFGNPIITTSRSGKLPPSAGPGGQLIYEAMKEKVPVYNVQLDVGNSKGLADFFAWVQRPGMPFEQRSFMIDDILEQLDYKMGRMPVGALSSIQDLLGEMQDKLSDIINELYARETKVHPEIMEELRRKGVRVHEMMSRLSAKVGPPKRGGSCYVVGGVPPPAYTIPENWEEGEEGAGGDGTVAADQQQDVVASPNALLERMQEEMERPSRAGAAQETRPGFDKATLARMVAEMQQEQK